MSNANESKRYSNLDLTLSFSLSATIYLYLHLKRPTTTAGVGRDHGWDKRLQCGVTQSHVAVVTVPYSVIKFLTDIHNNPNSTPDI